MSKLRSINTVIWSDPWFELLKPSAKLLFIYLVTNEKTNMLGVYEISLRKVSFETGISETDIDKFLKEFELNKKIRYAENRVLLLNFLKHQNYNFNMMKSAIRTYNELPKSLKVINLESIEESKQGFETLCKGFLGVSKYEVEDESEEEEESEDNNKPLPFSFFNSLISLGGEKVLVSDWIKVRKTKRLTNTETALKNFETELMKSKKDINFVLNKCVVNSWGGFKAEWLNNENQITVGKPKYISPA